ncbi:hypothetical protein HYH03_005465 [Edaphochlamys debaryana]|uniref:SET domain-containing protein n=1 Tax=Edaphochlamys debaryana TaxID=47281 RepID=A0A836C1D8_9CHLO|nr:hypothetical protein HYH03_005465 [Edaphochlamys debaryana]|eukprot:KAG2496645.1 hypothetical protein HYH03_005465 [Edaphochlamys debaryana]
MQRLGAWQVFPEFFTTVANVPAQPVLLFAFVPGSPPVPFHGPNITRRDRKWRISSATPLVNSLQLPEGVEKLALWRDGASGEVFVAAPGAGPGGGADELASDEPSDDGDDEDSTTEESHGSLSSGEDSEEQEEEESEQPVEEEAAARRQPGARGEVQPAPAAAAGAIGDPRCCRKLKRWELTKQMRVLSPMTAEGGVFQRVREGLEGKRTLRFYLWPRGVGEDEESYTVEEGDWLLFRPHRDGDPTHFDVEGWRMGPGGRWQRLGTGVDGNNAAVLLNAAAAGPATPAGAEEDEAEQLAGSDDELVTDEVPGGTEEEDEEVEGDEDGWRPGPGGEWQRISPGAGVAAGPRRELAPPRGPLCSAGSSGSDDVPLARLLLAETTRQHAAASLASAAAASPAARPPEPPPLSAGGVSPDGAAGRAAEGRAGSCANGGRGAGEILCGAGSSPAAQNPSIMSPDDAPLSALAVERRKLAGRKPVRASGGVSLAAGAEMADLSGGGADGFMEAPGAKPLRASAIQAGGATAGGFPSCPSAVSAGFSVPGPVRPVLAAATQGLEPSWGQQDPTQPGKRRSKPPEQVPQEHQQEPADRAEVLRLPAATAAPSAPAAGTALRCDGAGSPPQAADTAGAGACGAQGDSAAAKAGCSSGPSAAPARASTPGTSAVLQLSPTSAPGPLSPSAFLSVAELRSPRSKVLQASMEKVAETVAPAAHGAAATGPAMPGNAPILPLADRCLAMAGGTSATAAAAAVGLPSQRPTGQGAGPRLSSFNLKVPVTAAGLEQGYLKVHSAFAADAGLAPVGGDTGPASPPPAPLGLPLRVRDASSGEGAGGPSGGNDSSCLLVDATLSFTPACPGRKAVWKLLGLGGWMAYRGVAEGDEVHVSFEPPADFALTLWAASGQQGGGQHAGEAGQRVHGSQPGGGSSGECSDVEARAPSASNDEAVEVQRQPLSTSSQRLPRTRGRREAAALGGHGTVNGLALIGPPQRQAAKVARATIAAAETGAQLRQPAAPPSVAAARLRTPAAAGTTSTAAASAVRIRVAATTSGHYYFTGLTQAVVAGFFGVSDPGRAEHLTRVPLSVRPAEGSAGGDGSAEPLEGVRLMAYQHEKRSSAQWRLVGLRAWLTSLGAVVGDAVVLRRLRQGRDAGGDVQQYSVQLEQHQPGALPPAAAAPGAEASVAPDLSGAQKRPRAAGGAGSERQLQQAAGGGGGAGPSNPAPKRRKVTASPGPTQAAAKRMATVAHRAKQQRGVPAGSRAALSASQAAKRRALGGGAAGAAASKPPRSAALHVPDSTAPGAASAAAPMVRTAGPPAAAGTAPAAASARSRPARPPAGPGAPRQPGVAPRPTEVRIPVTANALTKSGFASLTTELAQPGKLPDKPLELRVQPADVRSSAADGGTASVGATVGPPEGSGTRVQSGKRQRQSAEAPSNGAAASKLLSVAAPTAALAQPAAQTTPQGVPRLPAEAPSDAAAAAAAQQVTAPPAAVARPEPRAVPALTAALVGGRPSVGPVSGVILPPPPPVAQPSAHLPASSVSHLHGCLPPGVPPPPLQPGELRLCGLTFHSDLAPSVRRTMQEWEANSAGGVGLARCDPSTRQISIPGVDGDAGGSEAASIASAAFSRHGLRRPILATRLARHLGLYTQWDAPLPSGPLPLSPDLVAPGPAPERGGLGLFARAAIKPSWVLGVVGGYVMPGTAAETYAARGLRQNAQLQEAVVVRTEGSADETESAWGFLAGSFRLRLPGLGPSPCGADGCELSMLGYGNEAALVNDPRRNPRAWAPGNDVGDEHTAAAQANCMVLPVSVRGLVLPVLVALRDIAPGEQLLRDYGAEWWRQLGDLWEVAEDAGLSPEALLHGEQGAGACLPKPPGADLPRQGPSDGRDRSSAPEPVTLPRAAGTDAAGKGSVHEHDRSSAPEPDAAKPGTERRRTPPSPGRNLPARQSAAPGASRSVKRHRSRSSSRGRCSGETQRGRSKDRSGPVGRRQSPVRQQRRSLSPRRAHAATREQGSGREWRRSRSRSPVRQAPGQEVRSPGGFSPRPAQQRGRSPGRCGAWDSRGGFGGGGGGSRWPLEESRRLGPEPRWSGRAALRSGCEGARRSEVTAAVAGPAGALARRPHGTPPSGAGGNRAQKDYVSMQHERVRHHSPRAEGRVRRPSTPEPGRPPEPRTAVRRETPPAGAAAAAPPLPPDLPPPPLPPLPPPLPLPAGWELRGMRLGEADVASASLAPTAAMTGPGGVLARLTVALQGMAPQLSPPVGPGSGATDPRGGLQDAVEEQLAAQPRPARAARAANYAPASQHFRRNSDEEDQEDTEQMPQQQGATPDAVSPGAQEAVPPVAEMSPGVDPAPSAAGEGEAAPPPGGDQAQLSPVAGPGGGLQDAALAEPKAGPSEVPIKPDPDLPRLAAHYAQAMTQAFDARELTELQDRFIGNGRERPETAGRRPARAARAAYYAPASQQYRPLWPHLKRLWEESAGGGPPGRGDAALRLLQALRVLRASQHIPGGDANARDDALGRILPLYGEEVAARRAVAAELGAADVVDLTAEEAVTVAEDEGGDGAEVDTGDAVEGGRRVRVKREPA